jgi:MFS superfamily sulfate permease-like transporter
VASLVFDAEAVTHADSTGLAALDQLTRDLERDEITLLVARLRTRMLEQFASAGLTDTIGRARFFPTVEAAVAASSDAPAGVR